MRGIGGDQQHLAVRRFPRHGERQRAAQVVLPTPPLPPTISRRVDRDGRRGAGSVGCGGAAAPRLALRPPCTSAASAGLFSGDTLRATARSASTPAVALPEPPASRGRCPAAPPRRNRVQPLRLDTTASVAQRAGRRRSRREPVDDDVADVDAVGVKRGHRPARFRHRHFLGQRDPAEPHPRRISQQRSEALTLAVEFFDQRVRPIATAHRGRRRRRARGAFPASGRARARTSEEGGRGQQPKHVPRWRRIDHDIVVRVPGREPLDLEEAEQFIDARQRHVEKRLDVVSIEKRAVLEDCGKRGAPG